ncbi:MAG: hypothetical protein HBSAPP03_13590 [Phycisphaerae bacterium]|nr:MAG: hypothetical protein HBSAPP03_13590 [Phycisphaerae bacterium]
MRTMMYMTAAVMAGLASQANAGIDVVGSTGAGWAAFPATLNNYSNAARPYWDQRSMDSGNRNIGNYLNGSYTLPLPAGSAASPNITPVWWSGAASPIVAGGPLNADPSVHFVTTGGATAIATTMLLEVAGYHNYNEIGWYNIADAVGSEVLHPIYTGSTAPSAAVLTFTPSPAWGLYIRSHQGYSGAGQGLLFFTESNRNRANGPAALAADDRLTQHFAIFGVDRTPGNERYTIGVEDLPLRSTSIECYGDYNDVVLTITAVPAPGAAALLGLGGVALLRRRR